MKPVITEQLRKHNFQVDSVHPGLGPWAWHERGGDVALGWVPWLVHGGEAQVGTGFLGGVFSSWFGAFSRGEDVGLGCATWNFFSCGVLCPNLQLPERPFSSGVDFW